MTIREWVKQHFQLHVSVNEKRGELEFEVFKATEADYEQLNSIWVDLSPASTNRVNLYVNSVLAIRKFKNYFLNKLASSDEYVAEMKAILDSYEYEFACRETFERAAGELNTLLARYEKILLSSEVMTVDSLFMAINKLED